MSNLQTLKGFRDYLPSQMAIRNEAIRRLKTVFEKYGFEELKTPALEYQEVLLGKYGAEAEKLMYLFKDPGGRNVGLKYDQTVPLARVVSQYPELPKPFKRYVIQPAWRAENTQKGRYREFTQCDIDTVGSASPLADAEILAVIYESLKSLEFKEFTIRINSRSVLFSLMDEANIPEAKWLSVIQSIDKLDKKTQEEVENELVLKEISAEQIKKVFESLKKAEPDEFLAKTIEYAKKLGVKENIKFDPTISRGLDYYDGPIYETVVTEPKIGSITGGGRYDKLLKNLGGPDLPATGTTIGLDRACDVIEELNLWPNINPTTTKVLVTIFSENEMPESLKLANLLRDSRINTEVYPDTTAKLDKQLRYADAKKIPYAVIIGPEEIKAGNLVLKNLKTKEQTKTTPENLVSLVK